MVKYSKFFLGLLVIFSNNCLSQEKKIAYYDQINYAEANILDSNYVKAAMHYDSAFFAQPKPFAKDYWNALVCSIKNNDNQKAFAFTQKLILKGFDLTHFQQPVFENFLKTKEWKSITENYDNLHRQYLKGINVRLKTTIDSLFALDQGLRNSCGMEKCRTEILKIDSSNYVKLFEVIKRYGFPDENDLGTNNTKLRLPHFFLFYHYIQANTGAVVYPILFNAMITHKFPPRYFAFCFNRGEMGDRRGKDLGLNLAIEIDDKTYFPKKNAAKININREELGLDSFEDYARKHEYMKNCNKSNIKQFEFDIWGGTSRYEFATVEDKERFISTLK